MSLLMATRKGFAFDLHFRGGELTLGHLPQSFGVEPMNMRTAFWRTGNPEKQEPVSRIPQRLSLFVELVVRVHPHLEDVHRVRPEDIAEERRTMLVPVGIKGRFGVFGIGEFESQRFVVGT